MPELSETTHSAGSRVKWQGMHICCFIFKKGLLVSDDVIKETSHFIRRAPLEDLREEKKILSIAGEDLLFVFWTKIRSLLGISSA